MGRSPQPKISRRVNEICMTRQGFLLGADKEQLRQRWTWPLLGEYMGNSLPAGGLGSPSAAFIHLAGIFCWGNTIGLGWLPSGHIISGRLGSGLGFQAL